MLFAFYIGQVFVPRIVGVCLFWGVFTGKKGAYMEVYGILVIINCKLIL